jgi:hypothetical protein
LLSSFRWTVSVKNEKGVAVSKGEKRQKTKLVTRWLEGYRKQRAMLLALGSIGTLAGAIVTLIVTWWATWIFLAMVLWVFKLDDYCTMGAWIILGLLFVSHFTVNRQHLENLKFDEESPGLTAVQFAADVAGFGSLGLFLTGPNTARSQVKVISLILLIGPAMLGLAWRLARASLAAWRMDVSTVAVGLAELLIAEKRVSVDELVKKAATLHPPRFLRELLLVDGVILLTSSDPGVTLTDSLRSEILIGVERLAAT